MAKQVVLKGAVNIPLAIPNVDAKYGPYTSIEEAFETLGPDGDDVLAIGLTVGIQPNPDGPITEYWFKDACESESDLVLKGAALPEGVVVDVNYVHTDNNFTNAEKTKLAGLENYDDTVITASLANKVDKITGKGLSTEDYTTVDKTKLSGIEDGAEVNIIEDIKVNGTSQTITNKSVDIVIPTADEYTLEEVTATIGYAKSYQLKKNSIYIGDKINIPVDLVIESGEVKTVTTPNVPYEGAQVGDKYIDLTLNDSSQDHIYIPVNDLVDAYTAGNGIAISNANVVSVNIDSNNSNGLSVGANGLALVNATTSTSGAMSSTDKTKLEGIESGAQANVNPDWTADSGDAEILNKPTTIAGYGITDAYIKNEIDNLLDTKQDIMQFSTLPEASSTNLGKIVQYTGATNANYTKGFFYKVVASEDNPPAYSWENINVQEIKGTASDISYDNTISGLTADDVQEAINELSSEKVDKEIGKGLSTNDYTDADKTIVDGVTDALFGKVDKVAGKGLSTNDYTTEDMTKLSGIESGAEVNIIETVKVNGIALTPDQDRAVDITIAGDADDITYDNTTSGLTATNVQDALDELTDEKVDKVTGKQLSTEDYTTAEKTKLSGIEDNADVNLIESISVNGTAQTITNKNVDIDVPTKTSDLTNDSNFIDNTVNDLVNYTTTSDLNDALDNKADIATTIAGYGITDAYTKTEIDNKISSVFVYKGSVATYDDLPVTGQKIGDVYNIQNADSTHHIKAGDNVAWDGNTWDLLGGEIDLSSYYTKTQTDTLLDDKVDKVNGKQLSTEDYTSVEKTKLASIEDSANVNIIETVKIDNISLTPDANKAVNIDLSGKVNEPATEGTNGQVLTTDGNGGRAWTTVSSNNDDDSEEKSTIIEVRTNLLSNYSPKFIQGTPGNLISLPNRCTWTDGENLYFSNVSIQLKFNTSTNKWEPKTWNNFSPSQSSSIWTDGENIYYSSSTTHYVLDKSTSTWETKTWLGLTSFSGTNIWKDGENIYCSNGSSQYILDKSTSTWETKIWNGLTSFYRSSIWLEGDNVYYSNGTNQYILDKSTSTWETKTWNGLTSFNGNNIWSDGENTYYSNGSSQYILDKTTSTWEVKTWSGLTSFNGSNICNVNGNCYCSFYSQMYVLNNSTWVKINDPFSNLSISCYNGQNVWTDGENTYYSEQSAQFILDKKLGMWKDKSWGSSSKPALGNYVWTDGNNIYYSSGTTHYVLNKSTSTWETKIWDGLTSFNGQYIWSDGNNIYYSNNANQYVLNKSTSTWEVKTWNGLTSFLGESIWSDGDNIYYSNNANQYVLNIETSTWTVKMWKNLTSFNGASVWTDGENIYYSSGSTNQYVLDKSTSTWEVKTWVGLPASFGGTNVWTDGENIYYSNQSNQNSYILNITSIRKTPYLTASVSTLKLLKIEANNTESKNVSYNSIDKTLNDNNVQDALDRVIRELYKGKSPSAWEAKAWTGLTSFSGINIWTDGENIYCSNGSSTTNYVLNKYTNTWDRILWVGNNVFYGQYVWSDGDNVYYSNSSSQYVLNKSTSTWETKTWLGLTSFSSSTIWTDGENIYSSNGSNQYVLDKSTSTWEVKTWNGLTNFYGHYIWSDGNNIYYSNDSTQYILDKSTSTWKVKIWNGLTNVDGRQVWTNGGNIYYSYGIEQYILDKTISTWKTKTWSGLTNFYGQYIWSDRDNIYYANGPTQYVLSNEIRNNKITEPTNEGINGQVLTTDGNGSRIWTTVAAKEIPYKYKYLSTWSPISLTSLTTFYGECVWSDGDNIYYTRSSDNRIYDKSTPTFDIKIAWNGLTSISGTNIWHEGENIYYSNDSTQYILDKSTRTWSTKTWSGLTSFYGYDTWTDGDNIYYSGGSSVQYVLNKETSTWSTKTWSNLTPFYGRQIWSDGDNIYYSNSSSQYILNKSTSTWEQKTWSGLTDFNGQYIWTDGDNIYYSNSSTQYILNKETSTWEQKTWTGLTSFNGNNIWSDGDSIYYIYNNDQYVLNKEPITVKEELNNKADIQQLGGMTFISLTQAQYDALVTKDSNTLYFITE